MILLALAVCCRPAAEEDNGERTAVMTARKVLTLADEVTLTFNVLDGKYSQASVLEDVEFTAKAYPKALAAYENENGASVVMMPEDCYSIGTVVVRKMETSGEIVSLDADSRCDGRFCSYCEALRKAGVPVKELHRDS